MKVRINLVIFCYVFVAVNCDVPSCTTPNGETGICVPLQKCQVLIKSAASEEPIAQKFLSESECDERTSKVCCGTLGNYTKHEEATFNELSKEDKRDFVLQHCLPTKKYCGLQHTDDYFYNSSDTSVDEFPWLVYIIGSREKHDEEYYLRREEFKCVGSLISIKYVISSKMCLNFAQWDSASPRVDMLFGLHHVHKKVNCITTHEGNADCTEPPIPVSSSHWKIFENVVLFRLDEKIEFSEFVRPICLPQLPEEIPKAGSLIMASGWSEKEYVEGTSFKLKKRMKYKVMSDKECQTNNPQKNAICGKPSNENTHCICTGDIGGPLMYRHEQRNWFAIGIIYLTDIYVCDESQPGTAMELTPTVVDWIIENMEP